MSPERTSGSGCRPVCPSIYGWVILACVCCASVLRDRGPAVSTLSIFVDPMTSEFGWSRTAMSAAVSLGGLLAALSSSPILGPLLDRHGARVNALLPRFL